MLALWLILAGAVSAQEGRSLPQVYDLALRGSEEIASSEQSIRQAEAVYRQALGFSLPSLSLRHESSWVERTSPAHQGMIRLSQSDLTGYRELAAIKAAKATERQRLYEKGRVAQLLLGDVGAAFFGLLQSQEDAAATRQLLEFAEKRLGELRERVRVGRTREADSIGQEFQIAALKSQLEESSRQLQARADLLTYLARTAVPAVKAPASEPVLKGTLESHLARVDDRPDVRAAREATETARAGLRVAKGDHLPRLGLTANYYGYRPTARKDEDWDAGVNVTLPLWSWGGRVAQVDEANAVLSGAILDYQAARRAAELQVRDAWRDFSSAARQLEIRRGAVDLARRDYDLQTRDERRGLVTSLEVLESLNRLNGARLALTRALLDARLTSLSLGIAAGLPAEELVKE